VTHENPARSRETTLSTAVPWRLADRIGRDAWRGPETVVVGPARFGFAHGFTQRANSAALLSEVAQDDIAPLIDEAEHWYRQRSRPALWQVSDGDLDSFGAALAARGYIESDLTQVMVKPPSGCQRDSDGRSGDGSAQDRHVSTRSALTTGWFEVWSQVSGYGQSDQAWPFLAEVGAGAWVEASEGGADAPGAVGLGIDVDAGHYICCMATRPEHRRLGLARAVLAELEQQRNQPALRPSVLQVGADNPAIGLYLSAGFVISHGYRYFTAKVLP
jgi:N-acetylglutamate synthase